MLLETLGLIHPPFAHSWKTLGSFWDYFVVVFKVWGLGGLPYQ